MTLKLSVRLLAVTAIAMGAHAMFAISAGATTVVPPKRQLAGHTYSQWLVKWWKLRLATPASASPCQRKAGVEVLIGLSQRVRATCRIPAGRPVYDIGPGSACSNIERPPFYGATPSARRSCAKRNDTVTSYVLKLDGIRLPLGDPYKGKFVVATRDFKFQLAADNILGIDKPGGRASAYGLGIGFTKWEAGSHSIRARVEFANGTTLTQRYRIVVRGEEGR